MKVQSSEKGQALILIILAVVAIFGFAALAVDGGRIYTERRRAQAAADSAALSAAYAAAEGKTHSKAAEAAKLTAEFNGFANNPEDEVTGVPKAKRKMMFEYHNPPISGPYQGDVLYHQVLITEKVNPIFSQLVFAGETDIVVEAVAFSSVDCNTCFSPGNAIHAMNPTAGSALEFDGNVNVVVKNGNIFSNSNASDSGRKNGGSGTIKVENGKVLVHGGWKGDTDGVLPKPTTGVPDLHLQNVPVPDCANAPEGTMVGKKGGTMTPGRHSSVKINGGDWTMEPGMYCIEGGFTVNGNATVSGEGVFIAMMSGDLKLNGGGEVQLKYADDLKDAKGNQWAGMLIYAPESNTSGLSLSGGNNTVYSGTVYAPGAECSLGGNSASYGYNAKVMCDTIKIHGSTIVYIDYDPTYNWSPPATVELTQ